MTFRTQALRTANRLLQHAGVQLTRSTRGTGEQDGRESALGEQCRAETEIINRHNSQTADDVLRLNTKYAVPVLGAIPTWEALQLLGSCLDPTDGALGAVSQLTHVLQTIDLMIESGTTDEDLLLVALVHDLGKLLLLTDEDPANIVCMNRFIEGEVGGGLEQATSQWNHDEFAYLRLRDLLPRELALLVRYHSVMPRDLEPYLGPADREFADRFHRPFFGFDQGSKSLRLRPRVRLEDFRSLVERRLPGRIEL